MATIKRGRKISYTSPDDDINDLIELRYSPHKINKLIRKGWKITDKELIAAWETSLEWFRFWEWE